VLCCVVLSKFNGYVPLPRVFPAIHHRLFTGAFTCGLQMAADVTYDDHMERPPRPALTYSTGLDLD